jgi:hypothetical protein
MMILETYTRVLVDADVLDRTVAFYKALLSGEETLRFAYPETRAGTRSCFFPASLGAGSAISWALSPPIFC